MYVIRVAERSQHPCNLKDDEYIQESTMSAYNEYTKKHVLARRTGAVALGVVAFPVMIFHPKRAQFYSYIHRVWSKTSDKPVWLAKSEVALNSHK